MAIPPVSPSNSIFLDRSKMKTLADRVRWLIARGHFLQARIQKLRQEDAERIRALDVVLADVPTIDAYRRQDGSAQSIDALSDVDPEIMAKCTEYLELMNIVLGYAQNTRKIIGDLGAGAYIHQSWEVRPDCVSLAIINRMDVKHFIEFVI